MRKLCVYGVAGSGKSTVSRLVVDELTRAGLTVEVIKLALPMYQLQQHIYATAGHDVDLFLHDNQLLRDLATHLRRISPTFIVEDFLRRLHGSRADVVINDDLRNADVDHPRLRVAGFRFLHIVCSDTARQRRLTARGDVTIVPDSRATWGFDQIIPDWTIDNSSDEPGRLQHQVGTLLDKWLAHSETG